MNQPDFFRKRSEKETEKTSWWLKTGIMAGIILIAFLTWHSLTDRIWQDSETQLAESQKEFLSNFNSYLIKSEKNPRQLLILGQKLASENLNLAVLVFEDAALKNKDYRDAYVNLGLAYLKQSQIEENKEKSHQKLTMAKDALERAAKIDPIYPYTYQLLQLVYKSLGDNTAFEQAKRYYETVTAVSTNPNYSN